MLFDLFGVPQKGIWSPLLFALFVRKHVLMLCYAGITTLLKWIPSGIEEICATLLSSDLETSKPW